MTTEREICGVCRGPWPCECSPQAAPVVMMESVDDDYARAIARRMREDKTAPLTVRPYDGEPVLRVHLLHGGFDTFCGHYQGLYDVDEDKRIAWCRNCGTVLDPYDVLRRVAGLERRMSERLAAAQELEKREAEREAQRLARAKQRRHRYAGYSPRKGSTSVCATCGEPRNYEAHTG